MCHLVTASTFIILDVGDDGGLVKETFFWKNTCIRKFFSGLIVELARGR